MTAFNLHAPPVLARCRIGDVLAVRTGGWAAKWIRFGAALRGGPNLDNHIVIVHHTDNDGTIWGIEGRPGGVGWVDCATYFNPPFDRYAVTNWHQPKGVSQRGKIAKTVEDSLRTKYDWTAIAADALTDLDLPSVWADREVWSRGNVPAHVVCSSLATYAYWANDLPGPYPPNLASGKAVPLTQPFEWTDFILRNGYNE